MADWKMIEYFDMTCPPELVVDTSSCGLGAMLTQKKSDGSLSVVEYASRKLSDTESLLQRGDRVVLPKSLQSKAVKLAHAGHQGIVKTKSLLRETVWFPGIENMVEKAVADGLPCQSSVPKSSHEPLQMTPLPDGRWKEVAVDFTGPFTGGEILMSRY